jgi:hypothetical protein
MANNIVHQHPIIEELFYSYSSIIGNDLQKYKNHVYRIFNYSLYLSNAKDAEKYAIAAFFHDVGIWTNHTFDYLQPSIFLVKKYLLEIKKEDWINEISLMIENHHKITSYKNNYKNSVEIFRKADWTDVSMSLLHFHIPTSFIKEAERYFPYKGFHFFLVRLFFKNLLKHPFKPLPMFKK